MPLSVTWSAKLDDAVRQLRGAGASWETIARAIGVSRNTAFRRGRRLGLCMGPLAPPLAPPPAPPREPPLPRLSDRPPLPPGHALSWGVLTAGTVLEGAAYLRRTLDEIAAGEDT